MEDRITRIEKLSKEKGYNKGLEMIFSHLISYLEAISAQSGKSLKAEIQHFYDLEFYIQNMIMDKHPFELEE